MMQFVQVEARTHFMAFLIKVKEKSTESQYYICKYNSVKFYLMVIIINHYEAKSVIFITVCVLTVATFAVIVLYIARIR
jgi:hypothetical protein